MQYPDHVVLFFLLFFFFVEMHENVENAIQCFQKTMAILTMYIT